MPTPIRSVTIWFNAFIPKHISGYTRRVPTGIHAGKTMIPGPVPHFSDGYLTDQRSFSNIISAKSRMHSEVIVYFTGNQPTIKQSHYCDLTTELDFEDGEVECTKKGDNSRMHFQILPTSTIQLVKISVNCSACNPCAPSSRLFGDIDFNGKLSINLVTRSVMFGGKLDDFPAFEAYATINNGTIGQKLFHSLPPVGNTVRNLAGEAKRSIKTKQIYLF